MFSNLKFCTYYLATRFGKFSPSLIALATVHLSSLPLLETKSCHLFKWFLPINVDILLHTQTNHTYIPWLCSKNLWQIANVDHFLRDSALHFCHCKRRKNVRISKTMNFEWNSLQFKVLPHTFSEIILIWCRHLEYH